MENQTHKRILFVFAHPDDELAVVIGMRELRRRGADVRALWVTRGDLTADPEVRELESTRIMDRLGLEPDRLTFLRFPDASTYKHLDAIVKELIIHLDEFRPDEVFVDAFEGGHIDHDCTHFSLMQAVARIPGFEPGLFEFPEYNNYWPLVILKYNTFIPDKTRTRFFPVKPRDLLFKRELAMLCQSQPDTVEQLNLFMLVNWPRLLLGEPYRAAPPGRDYLKKPHRGKLHYEGFLPVAFEDYRREARRLAAG